MTYKLWTMAGKDGVAPRSFKPRSPKLDVAAAGAAAYATTQPGGELAASLGPAAGLAAEAAGAAPARAAASLPARGAPSEGDQLAALHSAMAEHKLEIVRLAHLIRAALGVTRGQTVHLRMVLKTGILAGEWVCRPACMSTAYGGAVGCGPGVFAAERPLRVQAQRASPRPSELSAPSTST